MVVKIEDEPFRLGEEKETSLCGVRQPLVDSEAKEETEDRRAQEDRSVTESTLRVRAPTGRERRRISHRIRFSALFSVSL